MAEFHIGETADAVVEPTDAAGNPGASWDEAAGMVYTSTNPSAVSVVDEDANPKDAKVTFLALTTEPVFVEVVFDGRQGPDVNQITLRSEEINVVAGEATGGTLTLRLLPVPPA